MFIICSISVLIGLWGNEVGMAEAVHKSAFLELRLPWYYLIYIWTTSTTHKR